MRKRIFIRGLAALAGCALVLPLVGSSKNPVERPFEVRGDSTWVVSLPSGDAVGYESGEGTHIGSYTNQASGNWWAFEFSGTVTAANGDQFFWVLPGSSFYVEFAGGTGRFENLAGGFNVVANSEPIVTFPDADTMIVTYTYKGVGTVTY